VSPIDQCPQNPEGAELFFFCVMSQSVQIRDREQVAEIGGQVWGGGWGREITSMLFSFLSPLRFCHEFNLKA